MILVGNSRGNYADAARHFGNRQDNETVEVHQIRGFIGDDLFSAFQESYAASFGTKAKQHLYSLSLSPPKDADVSDEEFEAAIARAEQRLGLRGQPRVIVFHEKRGRDGELRRHAHAIFCRIDAQSGKAIQMPYDRSKLFDLSKELFLEYGWELPAGYENHKDRSPLNYTHAEHQQARRRHKYADDIKRTIQIAYERSDTHSTFANALKEDGYILARGGHAAFVAVDASGEVYSIARSLPVNTREVRARLGEPDGLPNVEEATLLAKSLFPQQTQDKQVVKEAKPSLSDSPIARRVKSDPEHVLSMITERESTFTHHTIAKSLTTYFDDPEEYRNAYEKVFASSNLVALNPDTDKPQKHWRYSTREMVDLEQKLQDNAIAMSHNHSFRVPSHKINHAIRTQNKRMEAEIGTGLSTEQETAIRHLTSREQLSCVIGVAGAGKSTMLNAAREAWEASGYKVYGAALAGKAAEGLQQSSGIQSRTLASWELSWENEVNQLESEKSVLVIDEAAMVGSRQLSRIIHHAKERGAKVCLIGDHLQLQAIEAGAVFRNITDKVKPAVLSEVYRQKENWQKQASKDFGQGNTQKALNAYLEKGRIEFNEAHKDTIKALASDYLNDFWQSDNKPSQLALAHRKADVKAINKTIRDMRKEAGELQDGITYKTAHGNREFATGDRILFSRNDKDLGVKNGMLGTVAKTEKGHLTVTLDDKASDGQERSLNLATAEYNDFTHGYTVTIHKSQGATVDKSYVLASRSMNSSISYVAMTRHKQQTKLYGSREEFETYGTIARKLSRARYKRSTLDYLTENHRDMERELFKAMRRKQSKEQAQKLSLNGPSLH